MGKENVKPSVAAALQPKVEATYQKIAPKGVQVSVTGRYESIEEAKNHPKSSGTVVIFVLGAEARRKAGLDADQASDFGAALINHEIGHALGREDKRDTSMMDDRIGTTAQPTAPNSVDAKKLADELYRLHGTLNR